MNKLFAASLLLLASLPALAQSSAAAPAEDPAHNQLRALRDGMLDAVKKGDIARQLTYLHPNVVVTWQNAEVSRGRDGVRKYLDRMLTGPDRKVSSYDVDLAVDELTILHGAGTGVSFGSSKEHIALTDGTRLEFPGRWSATLVREGDQWLIASLHASSNVFENPIVAAIKRWIYIAGGAGVVAGLVAGWLVFRRRKTADR